VLEGIDMTASGASPRALLRVGIALVNHLNHQVAVQTHRRFAVDILILYSLAHEVDPPFLLLLAIAIQLPQIGHKGINGNKPFPIGRIAKLSGRNSLQR